jgi:hypothetical protein
MDPTRQSPGIEVGLLTLKSVLIPTEFQPQYLP